MKKLLTLVAALLLSTGAFAQEKGDMAVNGTAGFSLTIYGGEAYAGFLLNAGFTYFVIDNLGVSLSASIEEHFHLTPSATYFMPLTERLYYTPTVSLDFLIKSPIGFGISLEYAAFEYRLNDHWALNTSLGELSLAFSGGTTVGLNINTGSALGVWYYL